MARNIGSKVCVECCSNDPEDIEYEEKPQHRHGDELGIHFSEYCDHYFAKARCMLCCAQYFAWFGTSVHRTETHSDLSYRKSFNEDPIVASDRAQFHIERYLMRAREGTDDTTIKIVHYVRVRRITWCPQARCDRYDTFASKKRCGACHRAAAYYVARRDGHHVLQVGTRVLADLGYFDVSTPDKRAEVEELQKRLGAQDPFGRHVRRTKLEGRGVVEVHEGEQVLFRPLSGLDFRFLTNLGDLERFWEEERDRHPPLYGFEG